MKFQIKRIPFSLIDLEDSRYLFSFYDEGSSLVESIKKRGLFQPVILKYEEEKKKYIVVSGIKRILASLKLDKRDITAALLDAGISPIESFLINVQDNISSRSLNVVEKSIILNKLLVDFNEPEDTVIQKFLPMLSLNPHKKVLEDHLMVFYLQEDIQMAIIRKNIPIENITPFKNFETEAREKLINLVIVLNIGLNKAKEIAEYIEEIHLRDHISPIDIINNVIQRQEYEQLFPKEKVSFIRKQLRLRRYPNIAEKEKNIEEKIKKLKKTNNIKIAVPASLEGNRIEFSFQISSPEELSDIVDFLLEIKEKKELRDILASLEL